MTKRNFFIFTLILVGFLILPEISLAVDENTDLNEIGKYLELPAGKVEDLIHSLINIFHSKWEELMVSPYSTPEEMAVPSIMKKVVQVQALNYLLVDAPLETTGKIIKGAVEMAKIARLILAGDATVILDKFEKESVKRAVEYGMNYLLQKEIRVTPGAIEFEYKLKEGGKERVIFQYIMIYKPLDAKSGDMLIRFYSPEPLKPPKNEGSIGSAIIMYTELTTDLPPFILNVQGIVKDYKWDGDPSIHIDFPPEVPDLGIKPLSRWEKYVSKPIKEEIKKTRIVLEKVLEASGGIVEGVKSFGGKVVGAFKKAGSAIKDGAISIWGKIKKSASKLGAQVGGFFRAGEEEKPPEISPELEEMQEALTSLKEELNAERELRNKLESKYESGTAALIEKLDDLTEMVDILNQRTGEVTESEIRELIEELTEAEKLIAEAEAKEGVEETERETVEGGGQEIIWCDLETAGSPQRDKVIFNEIAWMGTQSSANDEWIELKNISGTEVDLSGWQILDKDEQIKIIFNEGERVSFNGFYLLERTDDDSVPGISADKIYTGALNDINEALYLFNEDCGLEDEVLAEPNWPAGDKISKRTMERKNNFSWQSSRNIGGTANNENSTGYYFVGGGGGGGGGGGAPSGPTICSQENLSSPTHQPVIINEVAWMGTSSENWRNEWIELKNISDSDVSLEGWQILDKDEEIKIIFDEGERVSANCFYLLERTDDDSVPNIAADKIYTGNLEDENESLRLFDENCDLIDEVLADPDWPAGNKEERRSMERKENLGWHTYLGEGENGIMGTPKAENSVEVKPLQPFPQLEVSPQNLEFTAVEFSTAPQDGVFTITNTGTGDLNWTAYVSPSADGVEWLELNPESGTISTGESLEVSVSLDISGLTHGTYLADVIISANGIQGSPQTKKVNISLDIQLFPEEEQPLKILITEVQIEGDNTNHDFIELYNPNDFDMDISGYKLRKRNSRGGEDSIRVFLSGGIIPAKGYYLWASSTDDDYPLLINADTWTKQTIAKNNSIALLTPDNVIVSALAWGVSENPFVETFPFPDNPGKNQSLGRIWNEEVGEYKNTGNNSIDFEVQTPTPKSKNQTPGAPPSDFEIVVSDADTVWNLNLTTASADLIDSTDAPPHELDMAFVSHSDTVWSLDWSVISSDVIDSTDALPQILFEVFVSMGEALWNISLEKQF